MKTIHSLASLVLAAYTTVVSAACSTPDFSQLEGRGKNNDATSSYDGGDAGSPDHPNIRDDGGLDAAVRDAGDSGLDSGVDVPIIPPDDAGDASIEDAGADANTYDGNFSDDAGDADIPDGSDSGRPDGPTGPSGDGGDSRSDGGHPDPCDGNQPPTALDQIVSTLVNTSVRFSFQATDSDGFVADYTLRTAPTNGTLSGSGSSRVYTPQLNFTGTDTITYDARDSCQAQSNVARVSFIVTSVSDGGSEFDGGYDAGIPDGSADAGDLDGSLLPEDGGENPDAGGASDGGGSADAGDGGDTLPDGGCTTSTYFQDLDHDGRGDPNVSLEACIQPEDYVTGSTDCNPNDTNLFQWYFNVYIDGDSEGYTPIMETIRDVFCGIAMHVGFIGAPLGIDNDDTNSNYHPGATDLCNGVSEDGDLEDGEDEPPQLNTLQASVCLNSTKKCVDGTMQDSYTSVTGYEAGTEQTCDTKDNNCNGTADENLTVEYCLDNDNDTFGNPNQCVWTCTRPSANYVTNKTDCDDTRQSVHPGGIEICNTRNDDCDEFVDEKNAQGDPLDRVVPCTTANGLGGYNGNATWTETCTNGTYQASGTCTDPDKCHNGDTRSVTCSTNVGECTEGTQPQLCDLVGAIYDWVMNGNCSGIMPASEDLNGDGQLQANEPDGLDQNCNAVVDDGNVLMATIPVRVTGYQTGCVSGQTCNGDDPARLVYLGPSETHVDRTEVSVRAYKVFVTNGGTPPSNLSSATRAQYYNEPTGAFDSFPVIYVTHDQASQFCAWAGKRLPTEAEWEIAARGNDGRLYPWGGTAPTCDLANYKGTGCVGDTSEITSNPAQMTASTFGLFNMAGNVVEWTGDWYGAYDTTNQPVQNPTGATSGTDKIVRGGRWSTTDANKKQLYTYTRGVQTTIYSSNALGFRCVHVDPDNRP